MLPESDEEKALKLTRSSEDRGEFCMDWKLAKGMDHKQMISNKKIPCLGKIECACLISRYKYEDVVVYFQASVTSRLISSKAHLYKEKRPSLAEMKKNRKREFVLGIIHFKSASTLTLCAKSWSLIWKFSYLFSIKYSLILMIRSFG